MKEYEVVRYMREAKLLEICEGISDVQYLVNVRHILSYSYKFVEFVKLQ